MYTEQQVNEAYRAQRVDQDAQAQGWTPEECIKSICGGFENADELTANWIAEYRRGKETLGTAVLSTSYRFVHHTDDSSAKAKIAALCPDSELVRVFAGYRATSECSRWIGLHK